MPTTTTARMNTIADEREEEGFYTQANSIRAITEERNALIIERANFYDLLRNIREDLKQLEFPLKRRCETIDRINSILEE